MRSNGLKLIGILFVLFFVSCSYNWGQFRQYSVSAPSNLEVLGPPVSGRDCGFWIPSRWYANSIAEATRDALKSVPGATGLKDVEVTAQSYQYVIGHCIKVEGIPVREIALKTPNKKK